MFVLQFEFTVFEDGDSDVAHGEVELELVDGFIVDFDGNEALRVLPVDVDI